MARPAPRLAAALAVALAGGAALADGALTRAEIEDALFGRSWKHLNAEGEPAWNGFAPDGSLRVQPEARGAAATGRFRFEDDRICIRMDASGVERCWRVEARDGALVFTSGDRRNVLTRR